MHYFLAHGIAGEGEHSVDRFIPRLIDRGHTVIDVPLPVRHFWNVRQTLWQDVDMLLGSSLSVPPNHRIIIAHSHGCNIALAAAEEAPFNALWLFNPAVNRGRPLSRLHVPLDRVWCVHSPSDWTVRISKLLPFGHPFGSAGAFGLKHLPPSNNLEADGGHGKAFREPQLTLWADIIHRHSEPHA